jgi:3-dehydroquinate dehydratase-1
MALRIKDMVLGEGQPKICVPVMAREEEDLVRQLEEIKKSCFESSIPYVDLLEWRADFWTDLEETKVKPVIDRIHETFPKHPLLVTFRSKGEGGEREISPEEYMLFCQRILESERADILDVELFTKGDVAEKVLEKAKRTKKTKILLSSHDFLKTPPKEEMIERLSTMDKLGADILKLAVMPQTEKDVLTLLEATLKMKQLTKKPVVTMAMGRLGLISRLSGEIFGSAMTFGCVGRSSAPGQIEAKRLWEILGEFSK